MLVPFDQLPEEARIWIYPSDRPFRSDEILQLEQALSDFLAQWTAHSQSLEAGFVLPHDRFIVIGINQETAQASGCSIDSSVRFIQDLEKQFDIVLLDKMNVTFKNNGTINLVNLAAFQKFAKDGKIGQETIVFNNMVNTKEDFENNWEVPAKKSRHKRFLI